MVPERGGNFKKTEDKKAVSDQLDWLSKWKVEEPSSDHRFIHFDKQLYDEPVTSGHRVSCIADDLAIGESAHACCGRL
jgi:hypothetical protein